MPNLNQKGPMGQGAMTGRKMGKCTNFANKANATTENAEQTNGNNQGKGMGCGKGQGMGHGKQKQGVGRGQGGQGMGRGQQYNN